jgi:hypothetical protein
MNQPTELLATKVDDLPGPLECPVCETELIANPHMLTYEELTKVRSWTLAQLIAWRDLQARSGLTVKEMLAISSHGGEFVGVNGFHGMFVGIEKDGYTHS